jgi:hypothetical protein
MLELVYLPGTAATAVLDLPYEEEVVKAALLEALEAQMAADAAEGRPVPAGGPDNFTLARAVMRAARSCLQKREVGEATRILAAAPPRVRRRFPIRMLKARLLSRSGSFEPLVQELIAVAGMHRLGPKRDEILSFEVSQMGLGWRLGNHLRVRPVLWGALPDDPGDWLDQGGGEYIASSLDRRPTVIGDLATEAVLRVQGLTKEDIRERLLSIRGPSMRANFIYRARTKALLAPPGTPRAAEIIAYHDRLLRERVTGDLSAITRAMDAGRNAIVLMAHAGSALRYSAILALPGPKLAFGNAVVVGAGTTWVPTVRDPASLSIAYLKAARTLRKTPHLVPILPDGAAGSSRIEVTVEGIPFGVALGGAALARVAPSTLFFLRSLRRHGAIHLELVEGPQMGPETDAEEGNAAFAAFFAEGVTRILRSPLEDMETLQFLRAALPDGDDTQGDED